jgi:serine-type D-Ala-D-Ala carboxypeptidase/endopeptidase
LRGVVILANTAVDADDLGFATLDADAPLAPKAIVMPSAALDEYEGTYKLADKFLLKVFRINDRLFAHATGQSAFPIFPSAPNEFFAKVTGISISFRRDPKRVVSELVLHQNGDRVAPKLSASELPPEPKELRLDAARLGDYVGKYRFEFGAVLDVVLRSDHLEAQLTGQLAFPIFARAKDKFFYKVVDAQLDFERDAGDKVIAAVLHQDGRDMRAPRMTTHR